MLLGGSGRRNYGWMRKTGFFVVLVGRLSSRCFVFRFSAFLTRKVFTTAYLGEGMLKLPFFTCEVRIEIFETASQ